MTKIKISAVSYLNSMPFVYGLQNSKCLKEVDLQLDIPSDCARKLKSGMVDIGLVPVAIIPELERAHIVSDYCIGAEGDVRTVCLFSDQVKEELDTILLDHHSRSSVRLIRILAEEYWNVKYDYKKAEQGFEENKIKGKTGGVVIGDKVFGVERKYLYKYDLAREWIQFTGLPFVFAAWISNREIDPGFIEEFNRALAWGVSNIANMLKSPVYKNFPKEMDLQKYYRENISYELTKEKKAGMELFLRYIREGLK